jgi:hypothetical protein
MFWFYYLHIIPLSLTLENDIVLHVQQQQLLFLELQKVYQWKTVCCGNRIHTSHQEYCKRHTNCQEHKEQEHKGQKVTDHPLSLHKDSMWNQSIQHQELWDTIQKDIDRLCFDLKQTTKVVIHNVLFVWSRMNPHISYRQGMHEIVAILYLVVETKEKDSSLLETNVFILFFHIMNQIQPWYESNLILHSCTNMYLFLQTLDIHVYNHIHDIQPQWFSMYF